MPAESLDISVPPDGCQCTLGEAVRRMMGVDKLTEMVLRRGARQNRCTRKGSQCRCDSSPAVRLRHRYDAMEQTFEYCCYSIGAPLVGTCFLFAILARVSKKNGRGDGVIRLSVVGSGGSG